MYRIFLFPDDDPAPVVLLGLSQTAFLVVKTANSTDLQISKIYPRSGKPRQFFSIFGKNFGDYLQTVWRGDRRIQKILPNTDHITWSSDRIDEKFARI